MGLLDTPKDERFDRITRLASSVFNCRYSSITLIDADRQWFKSAVNLELSESGREVAFCNHTISQDDALIIPDTKKIRALNKTRLLLVNLMFAFTQV